MQQAMDGIQLVSHFGFDNRHWKAINQEIKVSLAQQNGTAGGNGEGPEERLCKRLSLMVWVCARQSVAWVAGVASWKFAKSLSSPATIISWIS